MNREAIEKRKQELQNDLQQTLANVQAINGAIQDCNYWLEQLEESEDDSNPE